MSGFLFEEEIRSLRNAERRALGKPGEVGRIRREKEDRLFAFCDLPERLKEATRKLAGAMEKCRIELTGDAARLEEKMPIFATRMQENGTYRLFSALIRRVEENLSAIRLTLTERNAVSAGIAGALTAVEELSAAEELYTRATGNPELEREWEAAGERKREAAALAEKIEALPVTDTVCRETVALLLNETFPRFFTRVMGGETEEEILPRKKKNAEKLPDFAEIESFCRVEPPNGRGVVDACRSLAEAIRRSEETLLRAFPT